MGWLLLLVVLFATMCGRLAYIEIPAGYNPLASGFAVMVGAVLCLGLIALFLKAYE